MQNSPVVLTVIVSAQTLKSPNSVEGPFGSQGFLGGDSY